MLDPVPSAVPLFNIVCVCVCACLPSPCVTFVPYCWGACRCRPCGRWIGSRWAERRSFRLVSEVVVKCRKLCTSQFLAQAVERADFILLFSGCFFIFLDVSVCGLRERLERLLPSVASADSRWWTSKEGWWTRLDTNKHTFTLSQTQPEVLRRFHTCIFQISSWVRRCWRAVQPFLVPGFDVFFHKYMNQFCSWTVWCSNKPETTRKHAAVCVCVRVHVCACVHP